MAEEENRYLAYLEDMHEDRKGQKQVKVRWFHYNREVKGVVSLRNHHPKEVFITPYAQVISVECVDDPAIVLTREHYEKCLTVLPQYLLARLHLCFRQFKSNRVKPFKLSKLCGYFDRSIFSYMDSDLLDDGDLTPQDNVIAGTKRTRSCSENEGMPFKLSGQKLNYNIRRKLLRSRYVEYPPLRTLIFNIKGKVELLCQDSGIRGCWFRCTILQVSHKQIRVQYDDLMDEDGSGNLEEWIPAFMPAMPDKFGMRHRGRPIFRPALLHNESHLALEAGAPVDAWWSDGWWERVLIGIGNSEDGILQVFVPSESLFLNVHGKKLRASRDWVGDRWVEIEPNASVFSAISTAISPDTKLSTTLVTEEAKSDEILTSGQEVLTDVKVVGEEKRELACLAHPGGILENMEVDVACLLPKDESPENLNCSDEELQLSDEHKEFTANLFNSSTDDNTNDDLVDEYKEKVEGEGSETFEKMCNLEQVEAAVQHV